MYIYLVQIRVIEYTYLITVNYIIAILPRYSKQMFFSSSEFAGRFIPYYTKRNSAIWNYSITYIGCISGYIFFRWSYFYLTRPTNKVGGKLCSKLMSIAGSKFVATNDCLRSNSRWYFLLSFHFPQRSYCNISH